MRKWIKHAIVRGDQGNAPQPSGADDHFALMGGYAPDDAYQSKEQFFARHLEAHPRLVAYDRYLQRSVSKGETILSVASGRCANELKLMETIGCNIICSDLREPPCLAASRLLFPYLRFAPLDVTSDGPPGVYDSVLSLSLIYALDDRQLEAFFSFVITALKPSGRLLLDLAGSPDNLPSFMLHDVFLPAEARVIAAYRTLRHRTRHRVEQTTHGYRRTLEDVVRVARRAGLVVTHCHEDGFDLDFRRGVLLSRVASTNLGVDMLTRIGRRMPYIRMVQMTRSVPDSAGCTDFSEAGRG